MSERAALEIDADALGHLVAASRRHAADPLATLPFPDAAARDRWYTSPQLLTVHGTPLWDDLGDGQRRALSFWEAVNFYSLNIHGERALLTGLTTRLYRTRTLGVSKYLHHFVEEENRHSAAFAEFCLRYASRIYPPRTAAFHGDAGDQEVDDFLFFARVLVFEEIADHYNRAMAGDERLEPIARAINAYHHADESRHLRFGRLLVGRLAAERLPRWSAATRAAVDVHLRQYIAVVWRDYYNPTAYLDAGLAAPYDAVTLTWTHPAQVTHRHAASRRARQFLVRCGALAGPVPGDEP